MNFNATAGAKQPFGRKVKRVSHVDAMGYNPYAAPPAFPEDMNPAGAPPVYEPQQTMQPGFQDPGMQWQQQNYSAPNGGGPFNNYNPNMQQQQQQPFNSEIPIPGLNILGPTAQSMAMQYTQQLANTGSTAVKKELERFVPVSKLKYYFAVDTKYVLSKLGLLMFPFTHSDWSIKYEQDGPVQPRYEVNAPDLYIPTMAYMTYIFIAGLVLGMQQRFTPEQISIQSSFALAVCLVELALYSCTLYVMNIQTSLSWLDMLAYISYKFVGIIISVLFSVIGGSMGYYIGLGYFSMSLAFFLVRSLRAQVLSYVNRAPNGNKRRLYFLLFVAGAQPVISWWLSYHLIKYTPPAVPAP